VTAAEIRRSSRFRHAAFGAAVAAVCATGALPFVPATAGAASTCRYTGAPFHLLEVELPANGDAVQLAVPVPGGDIEVRAGSAGGVLACAGGTPTVSNTNFVSVSAGGGSNRVDLATANRFAPGATPETGDDEIEIGVDFHDQRFSLLRVIADNAGARFRAGSDGINTNAADSEAAPDADVALVSRVQRLELHGGGGGDSLGAQGGAGTGSALSQDVLISASDGADQVTGGEGSDVLLGGSGTNQLFGRGGNDVLVPGTGGDLLSGDAGIDVADFGLDPDVASGVTVDLTRSGFQDTGGSGTDLVAVESVTGTSFDDVLRGNAGPNTIDGREGDDVLEGRAGNDTLFGDDGDDALEIRDGGPDQAFCGTQTDTATADALGVDALTDCENTLFPGTPAPGTPPRGTPPEDTTPPAFLGAARVRPATFAVGSRARRGRAARSRVRRGTTFRYRLSEAASVRFTIERRTRGRTVGARCRAQMRSNRDRRACTRYVRVGAFAQQASAGDNRKRFSGRIGDKQLRPGRHRARLVATDPAGNRSKTRRITFTVVPAGRRARTATSRAPAGSRTSGSDGTRTRDLRRDRPAL
jgi:hypothetical protein